MEKPRFPALSGLEAGQTPATDLTGFIRAVTILTHRENKDHNQPSSRGNPSGLDLTMFQQLHSWENLLLAYRKASRGKRGHPNVAAFEYRLEDNLLQLQHELQTKTYQPGAYHSFYIHDPKKRLISAAPFYPPCPLSTFYFPPPTAHCPLSTFHFLLSTFHCSLITAHRPLNSQTSPTASSPSPRTRSR
ncbi:hypothetical protein FBQ81_12480 [Chloroflexi bacterium CFX6]|nr:hypothetical protein [Chloroflexi bacterium CFX6]